MGRFGSKGLSDWHTLSMCWIELKWRDTIKGSPKHILHSLYIHNKIGFNFVIDGCLQFCHWLISNHKWYWLIFFFKYRLIFFVGSSYLFVSFYTVCRFDTILLVSFGISYLVSFELPCTSFYFCSPSMCCQ